MHQRDTRTGLEVIDRKACLELLAQEELGRLGLIEGGAPLVLPINYALDGDQVVFRTAPGTKLDLAHGHPACFEIDDYDRTARTGWSVVVRGHLQEITPVEKARWERVQDLPDPWAEGPKAHVLAVVPESITGRRVSEKR